MAGVSAPRGQYKCIIIERIAKEYVYTKVRVGGVVSEDTQKYIIITQSSGKFFEEYGYDAFMFGFLFDYKVLQNGKTYKCGFPDSSLTKITNKLSDLKISYQIIYRGRNPFVKDFKKINQYSKYKLIALQKLDIKERMDALVEKVKSLNEEQAKKVMLELEKCLE